MVRLGASILHQLSCFGSVSALRSAHFSVLVLGAGLCVFLSMLEVVRGSASLCFTV
jgi:hypothetical protein